jgi:hypothetical protein
MFCNIGELNKIFRTQTKHSRGFDQSMTKIACKVVIACILFRVLITSLFERNFLPFA